MLNSMWPFWSRDYCKAWRNLKLLKITLPFNMIMISSIPLEEPKNGLKNRKSSFWTGLHNFQTLVPLNTPRITSRDAFQVMKMPLQEFINYGKE